MSFCVLGWWYGWGIKPVSFFPPHLITLYWLQIFMRYYMRYILCSLIRLYMWALCGIKVMLYSVYIYTLLLLYITTSIKLLYLLKYC